MKFKSPLGVSNFFWTPKSYEELEAQVLRDFTGKERTAALTTMAFSINMCAQAVEDEAVRQSESADDYIEDHNLMQAFINDADYALDKRS